MLQSTVKTYNLEHGLLLTYSEEGEEHIQGDTTLYTIKIQPVWKWLLDRELLI